MIALGTELAPKSFKMGFHISPFTTIDHIHLHVLAAALRPNPKTWIGYPVWEKRHGGKGWSIFVSAEQVESILGRRGRVRVWPSRGRAE